MLSDWSKSWCNMQIQSSYKVHSNTIINGDLSDSLCDSENSVLTLVRLNTMISYGDYQERDLYKIFSQGKFTGSHYF